MLETPIEAAANQGRVADGSWTNAEPGTSSAIHHPSPHVPTLGEIKRRVSQWWHRRTQAGSVTAGTTWDPLIPASDPTTEDALDRARLAERIMLLATLCRASYGSFTAAAQHSQDGGQSEWLQRCARQRKALASELRGIVLVLAEGNAVSPPWQRWVAQVAIENTGGWGESWMGRCVRGEENLLRLYEQLFKCQLPSGMSALLQRQYEQITGTLKALRGRQGIDAI